MSDTPKKPEQSTEAEQPAEKINDLPAKTVNDSDAQAVKGGQRNLERFK
jgi:hypothetical protein